MKHEQQVIIKRWIQILEEYERTRAKVKPRAFRNGNLFWLAGVILDITSRKQAEEDKANLEALLFQLQKIEGIGTLAAGIAHEFNNILSVIQKSLCRSVEKKIK